MIVHEEIVRWLVRGYSQISQGMPRVSHGKRECSYLDMAGALGKIVSNFRTTSKDWEMIKRLGRITYVAAALFAQSAFASNAVPHDQVTQAALKAAYQDMAKEASGGAESNSVELARLRAFVNDGARKAEAHQQSDAYDFEMRVERDGQLLLASSIPGVVVRSSGYSPAPALSMTTCSTPVQQEECRGDQYAALAARPEKMGESLAMSLEFELRDTVQGKTPAVMESLYWKGTVKVPQGKDLSINLDGKTVLHLKAKTTAM